MEPWCEKQNKGNPSENLWHKHVSARVSSFIHQQTGIEDFLHTRVSAGCIKIKIKPQLQLAYSLRVRIVLN